MFKDTQAFSGFAVDDSATARAFYEDVLGLPVEDGGMEGIIGIQLGTGAKVMVYPKPGHVPADFTVLNFPVEDVEAAVDALTAKGVRFEQYGRDDLPQDDKGIMRGHGPDIAWFKDPAGNILSVLED